MTRTISHALTLLLLAGTASLASAQELTFTEAERTPMACDATLTVDDIASARIEKPAKPYTIAFSVPSYANPYIQALLYGAKKAADEAGATLTITAGSGFMDPASQITQLENALTKSPDAVLINPADPDALALVIDETVEAGTPVVDVGTLSNSELSYKLVQDDYSQGVIGAEAIIAMVPDGGKGIIMGGPANASWARRRVAGFLDTIAKNPKFEVAATVSTDIDPQEGLTKFLNSAQANPDITWIYGTGSFLLAPQSIPEDFKDVTYVAGGLTNVTEDALKQKSISAVLPDFPVSTGYFGVKIALDVLAGKEVAKRNCAPVAAMSADDLGDTVWAESSILPADFKDFGQ
jgi:ribose transport system substrate-binding protein